MISARLRSVALLLVAPISLFVLGCFAARSKPPSHAPTPPPATVAPALLDAQPLYLARTDAEAQRYVGDAVCAPCHPAIGRQHGMSGHHRSLRTVTAIADARYFRSSRLVRDAKADAAYRTLVRNGECDQVNEVQGATESIRARIAVGSGRNGLTYLGRDPYGQWYILRLSYYTHLHGWDFTPGQEPDIASFADPKGQTLSDSQVSGCLSCHATSLRMTPEGLDSSRSRPGVGCESCHGPGKEHVEAMRGQGGGRTHPAGSMEDLGRATAARITRICGGCHSALVNAHIDTAGAGESVSRFAASALTLSRCFQKSGTLSCITCHDPHSEVANTPSRYEAVCLRCHSNPPPAQRAVAASRPPNCKIDPRHGCIGCHMPTQRNPSFPHTQFHNHWIKIWGVQSVIQ
jgi:hypothetical protein